MIKAFAPLGGDWDKNGIHPRPLHHPCVNKRGGPQGDPLLCWQQRDGPNHSEERPG